MSPSSRSLHRLMARATASVGLALSLFCSVTPSVHAATTITVPAMQPTIQAAINAASPGDTVVVSPGTYRENIDFTGKPITVESSNGPASTVIDGGGAGPVATFKSGESRSAVLQGFTLQHGATSASSTYEGGGVHIDSSSPSILGNVISGNGGCDGIGISVAFASPMIKGNTITDNVQNSCSGGDGGGIYVRGAASAQIIGNTISGNHADSGGGIGLFAAGTPTVEDNVITGNGAGQGAGIDAVNQSDAAIVQNIVAANSGQGIYQLVPSGTHGATLTNDTIAGNTGAGLYLTGYDDQVLVINTIVTPGSGAPSLTCDTTYDATPPTFVTDDVTGNFSTNCLSRNTSTGDMQRDPLYVNAPAGDYHLSAGSPAIDAGTNSAPNLPTLDLDGNARIVNGIVDLGVYEKVYAPGAVGNLQAVRGKTGITVSWSAPASTGGSAVTSYVITESPGATQTVSASTTSVTFTNVRRTVTYTFTVAAVNSVGTGPSSSVTSAPRS